MIQQLEDRTGGKVWTLSTAMSKTMDRRWKDSKSERTTQHNINSLERYFGKKILLSDITTEMVDAFVKHCEKRGNSNGTINRKLATLSTAFKFAIQREVIRTMPKLERKKEPKGRIRFLSYEEEAKLLGLLKSWGKTDHWDLFVFLIDTGARLGEALRAAPKDVSDPLLAIWENKASEPRSIPMTSRVKEVVARRSHQKAPDSKLWPYTHTWVRHVWDRAKGVMGLETDDQFVPHCLRHTCASRLVQKGFPIAKVQKWMGHKTITMTMRYSHLSPVDLLSGADLLEQVK